MRTKTFNLVMVAAVAAAVTACGRPADQYGDRVCTDRAGRRVPDQQCQGQAAGGSSNAFLWYFLGRSMGSNGGGVPGVGGYVSGGSYQPTSGVRYGAPGTAARFSGATSSRGGFGSTAAHFSAGS